MLVLGALALDIAIDPHVSSKEQQGVLPRRR